MNTPLRTHGRRLLAGALAIAATAAVATPAHAGQTKTLRFFEKTTDVHLTSADGTPKQGVPAVADILDACRRFPLKKRSRITFEYVMLDGVNDTPEDARRLVRLLSGIKAKVNLIPLNPAPGIPYERPSDARVNRFAQILAERFITVSVRKSRGQDIRAACGQLIVEGGTKKSAAQQMALLLR